MKDYFKMLENYIKDLDISYNSIKDLTIDLAKSGGYYRDIYNFNCGTSRERTLYRSKFNSDLSAMWLCYYKKLFMNKLNRYPELYDYYVFIINKTFYMVMQCINLDKLVCDDVVNKYVNMTLSSRIKEALGKIRRTDDDSRFCHKDVFNNRMFSLDYLVEKDNDSKYFEEIDDLEIDLRNKLEDNFIGNKLLDCLLFSNEKLDFKNIDLYLNLSKDMCTEDNKVVIANSFNIIKYMLIAYNGKVRKVFRKINPSNILYSFEH